MIHVIFSDTNSNIYCDLYVKTVQIIILNKYLPSGAVYCGCEAYD